MTDSGRPPVVAHIIQRLAVGGLENGLVNLINHMPEDRYRHVIVCLADATDYSRRITRKNVSVIALHQRQGQDFATHWRLLKLLQRLRPAIVHTRNLAALKFQLSRLLLECAGGRMASMAAICTTWTAKIGNITSSEKQSGLSRTLHSRKCRFKAVAG